MLSLFLSGKWQNISPPSIYKCVTLNNGESSFNWSSWKSPSLDPGCRSYKQQGKWCRNRMKWEIFLTFHQQPKVISHQLTQCQQSMCCIHTCAIPSVDNSNPEGWNITSEISAGIYNSVSTMTGLLDVQRNENSLSNHWLKLFSFRYWAFLFLRSPYNFVMLSYFVLFLTWKWTEQIP